MNLFLEIPKALLCPKGIIGFRNIFPEVIALINSGRLPVEKLITNVVSLDEIIIKGFESLLKDPSDVKILVDLETV